jgi:hypothetical protein
LGIDFLEFINLQALQKLPGEVFRTKPSRSKSKFQKKSEDRLADQSAYVLDNFSITQEIDQTLSFGTFWDQQSEALRDNLELKDRPTYRVPGKIIFFRVATKNPSSKYFRFFDPFLSTSRKMFPQYCQAVAAIVAKIIFVKIQEALEIEKLDASILLFIHDQYIVLSNKKCQKRVAQIIKDAVESEISNFGIRYSEEAEEPSRFFRK